jgi:hypothetical protein
MVGEPLGFFQETPKCESMAQAHQPGSGCNGYASQKIRSGEQSRARNRIAEYPDHTRPAHRLMRDPTEGRDSGTPAKFETSTQDRRDPAKTSTSEQIRQMRDFYGACSFDLEN